MQQYLVSCLVAQSYDLTSGSLSGVFLPGALPTLAVSASFAEVNPDSSTPGGHLFREGSLVLFSCNQSHIVVVYRVHSSR